MNNFGYEIDFLPVGNGDKSGDAIAIRYASQGKYKIMVVDGGTKESGKKLLWHIDKYYNTDYVDYVVNTHPDQDHASGLTEVLENLKVGQLWIHRPWLYVDEIVEHVDNSETPFIRDKRTTIQSIKDRFQWEYYKYAKKLESIANKKRIIIKEPYQGCQIGDFIVLSPNKKWYLYDLIPNSDKTQEIQSVEDSSPNFLKLGLEKLFCVVESLGFETLRNGGKTSRENESSVILYANFNNQGILLTGDAGNEALQNAYNFANKELKIDISNNLKFIQIPHHGSRRNVSPKVLNQIIGNKMRVPVEPTIIAFVSVGKDDIKHPRRVVTNAFIRRGCVVIETKGKPKMKNSKNMPERNGWIAAEPTKFYNKVEPYE